MPARRLLRKEDTIARGLAQEWWVKQLAALGDSLKPGGASKQLSEVKQLERHRQRWLESQVNLVGAPSKQRSQVKSPEAPRTASPDLGMISTISAANHGIGRPFQAERASVPFLSRIKGSGGRPALFRFTFLSSAGSVPRGRASAAAPPLWLSALIWMRQSPTPAPGSGVCA